MILRRLLPVMVVLTAACGESNERLEKPSVGGSEGVMAGTAAPAAEPREAVGERPATIVPVALPQIAYTFEFTLELPAKAVLPLFERHRRACEAAGPARCQIVGAETRTVAGTDLSATLTLRAEGGWLGAFRSRLAGDATGSDGRVAASKTESEDLGRAISDSGARLRALTTLQGRLEALLANRTGKLADLLAIERELARVGGELDATRSALADMRGRVALQKATVIYRPDSLAVAGAEARGTALPGSLWSVATESLFLLLNLLAAIVPWALLIGLPVALLWRWLQRRRRAARLDADAPAP